MFLFRACFTKEILNLCSSHFLNLFFLMNEICRACCSGCSLEAHASHRRCRPLSSVATTTSSLTIQQSVSLYILYKYILSVAVHVSVPPRYLPTYMYVSILSHILYTLAGLCAVFKPLHRYHSLTDQRIHYQMNTSTYIPFYIAINWSNIILIQSYRALYAIDTTYTRLYSAHR